MKKIYLLLIFLFVLVGCSKEEIVVNDSTTYVDNLTYYLDDSNLKSKPFEIKEFVAFKESNLIYFYLTLNDVEGLSGVYFDRPNGDFVKGFLSGTTGSDEYLFSIPGNFFDEKEILVIGFWKQDKDNVNIFVKRNEFKLCDNIEKINEIEAKYPDIFDISNQIDIKDLLIVDDSRYKPEYFEVKLFTVTERENAYQFRIMVDTIEDLNVSLSINKFSGSKYISLDNSYNYSFDVEKSEFSDFNDVSLDFWQTGSNNELSVIVPKDALCKKAEE